MVGGLELSCYGARMRLKDAPKPSLGAGWYDDPVGRYLQRWFDGQRWTRRVTERR